MKVSTTHLGFTKITASEALSKLLTERGDFLARMNEYNELLLEQAVKLKEEKYEKLFYMEDADALFVGEESVE